MILSPFMVANSTITRSLPTDNKPSISISQRYATFLNNKNEVCLCCNAKRGAKTDPTKHGKFLTHGSYTTVAILFSAATLYQLGMFLHFKHLGISGSSLFNTGTKSTKRKISEIQGKTNEIQSIDYQPTFADRLDKIKECNLISMLSSIWLMLVKKVR